MLYSPVLIKTAARLAVSVVNKNNFSKTPAFASSLLNFWVFQRPQAFPNPTCSMISKDLKLWYYNKNPVKMTLKNSKCSHFIFVISPGDFQSSQFIHSDYNRLTLSRPSGNVLTNPVIKSLYFNKPLYCFLNLTQLVLCWNKNYSKLITEGTHSLRKLNGNWKKNSKTKNFIHHLLLKISQKIFWSEKKTFCFLSL